MKKEDKGEEKKMERKEEILVKLVDEKDDRVEDRVAYCVFAMSTLDIVEVSEGWFEEEGKLALFLHTEARGEAQNRIAHGDYKDFSPNEERLAYFSAYMKLWRKREEEMGRIEEIIGKLKALRKES